MEFIDLKTQYKRIEKEVNAKIQKVLEHGRFIMGPEIAELEKKLADYAGVRHCIGVSSGTSALQAAMMALDIGPGDEVITSAFTFIATGETIALGGATPVFADIDPKTCNIDPASVEKAVTPKTKAVIPVGLYGQCADMDGINGIAEKHGLSVIDDAAQSFGATYKGKKSCSMADIACTSFFPAKPLGCYGDGGACFTNDDDLAAAMREIRVHGQTRRYRHTRLGTNARLDTLQAAILLPKLEIFPKEVELRQKIARRYDRLLSDAGVSTPYIEPCNTSVYAQYTIRTKQRDHVRKSLSEQGIPTAVHYPLPLHLQPVFRDGCAGKSFPEAEKASAEVLSLPMHPYLDDDVQDKVVRAVKKAMASI